MESIQIRWTRAHVGTVGNERADELAKAGTESTTVIEVGYPFVEVKNKIESFVYAIWRKNFEAYEGARMGKLFYSGPDKNKAKYVTKLPRMKLARFIRIISGHNSLFYFRNKIDAEVKPNCRFCGYKSEDFYHLLNECPRFIIYRREYFYNKEITNDMNWSVKDLIDFSNLPGINDALEGDTGLEWYGIWYDGDSSDDGMDRIGIG